MNTTLLIMAAGIGSRYGAGIKQLQSVGLHGEIIMDYSIHDAIEAGFNKIIFVIRKDIEEEFRRSIGDRIEKICEARQVSVHYSLQSIDDIPAAVPAGRTKPWGTGHAVLAARRLIAEPTMVINADDYYGKEIFAKMHSWLCAEHAGNAYAMAGFILKNTLSDNGSVTRGICSLEPGSNRVCDVVETKNIIKTEQGASANGAAISPDSYVSMNMWGFPGTPPAFLTVLENGFKDFFATQVEGNPTTAEYLLPTIIGNMLRRGECTVEALETRETWFGITYQEDKQFVADSFKQLIADGKYHEELYSDLT